MAKLPVCCCDEVTVVMNGSAVDNEASLLHVACCIRAGCCTCLLPNREYVACPLMSEHMLAGLHLDTEQLLHDHCIAATFIPCPGWRSCCSLAVNASLLLTWGDVSANSARGAVDSSG
jgi:hypothetical protein